MTIVEGLDLTYGEICHNWDQIEKSGYRFVIPKATEGRYIKDRQYSGHFRNAKNAGLLMSSYHYYRLEYTPRSQAEAFLSTIKSTPLDFAPSLDFHEATLIEKPRVAESLLSWLTLVEKSFGLRPLIRTSKYFWESFVGTAGWEKDYSLWVVDSFIGRTIPETPEAWEGSWLFWQYVSKTPILGILGAVNLDRYNGDTDSLFDLSNKPSTPLWRGEILQKNLTIRSGPGVTYQILGKQIYKTRVDIWKEESESVIDTTTGKRVDRLWGALDRTLSRWSQLLEDSTVCIRRV